MQNQELTKHFTNTGFFDSSYDERILSYLISISKTQTAKEIATNLDIPDSKVYPTVNRLQKLGIVQSNTTNRPHRYFFNDPERLLRYLQNQRDQHLETLDQLIDTIMEKTYTLWNPEEKELGNIAHLFHDKELEGEIIRQSKLTDKELILILSEQSLPYISNLRPHLEKLLGENKTIKLAIPPKKDLEKIFKPLIQSSNQIRIKENIWQGNSYLIRDGEILLNITHRPIGDVGILTNDTLLVPNIRSCWNDTSCCVNSERIQLEVRE